MPFANFIPSIKGLRSSSIKFSKPVLFYHCQIPRTQVESLSNLFLKKSLYSYKNYRIIEGIMRRPEEVAFTLEAFCSTAACQPLFFYKLFSWSLPYFGFRGKNLSQHSFWLPFSLAFNQNSCLSFPKRALPQSYQKVIFFLKMAIRKPFRFSDPNKTN